MPFTEYSGYLDSYASSEIRIVDYFPKSENWDEIVVIPAYGEFENVSTVLRSLDEASLNKKVLALLIINAPTNGDSEKKEANHFLWNRWSEKSTSLTHVPRTFLVNYSPRLTLVFVDRFSNGFEFHEKSGVGLARKIGCDIALALFSKGFIKGDWISTTDCDVKIPHNYYHRSCLPEEKGLGIKPAALLHSFEHEIQGEWSKALSLYDESLRYYETGLKEAYSPYAFQTLGSTIEVAPWAYAAVRGFSDLKAAEDFYFLNKIAKVGKIIQTSDKILISCRISNRVPFGTGVSTGKIYESLKEGIEPELLDHPDCFRALKQILKEGTLFCGTGDYKKFIEHLRVDKNGELILKSLSAFEWEKNLNELLKRKTLVDRVRNFHTWWDAFKTLKWIHWMRDNGLGRAKVSSLKSR